MGKYEYVVRITYNNVKNKLPERFPESHKGTFGRLLCICGSKSMPGAAYFCIAAAVKSGVGLVDSVVTNSVYTATSKKISEAVFHVVPETNDGFMSYESINKIIIPSQKCTAVVAGCGMGWNSDTKNIIYNLIRTLRVPLIIDADGINVVSENINILKEAFCPIIITPHIKEMSRLTKESTEDIIANKARCVKEFSEKYGTITVLKGNKTVIADKEGHIYVNMTGNAGMAKGGSGDVLSGIIGSLAAQGIKPIDAATCGVFIHGLSGDECSEKFSMTSMTPTDIINELPEVFLGFENNTKG